MSIFSKLGPIFQASVLRSLKNAGAARPMSGHNTFVIAPSRWQWKKFKDQAHFYVMLGVIPLTAVTLYANIFIGPATLSEIPPDYEPKYWEYYRSPITRFIARYLCNNPQEDYEKMLAYIYIEEEKKKLRKLEAEIKERMSERSDYQAYFYKPVMAKYHRVTKEAADYLETIRGD